MSLRFRLTGACAVVLLAGCGSWGRVGSQPGTKPGETLAQVLDLNAVYRKLGLDECIASSPKTYVEIAVRLGRDSAYRDSISRRLAAAEGLFEDRNPALELEQFFLSAMVAQNSLSG